MKYRTYFRAPKDDGDVIAIFGEARLIKFLNGRYELRGGSNEDRLEAKKCGIFRDVTFRTLSLANVPVGFIAEPPTSQPGFTNFEASLAALNKTGLLKARTNAPSGPSPYE